MKILTHRESVPYVKDVVVTEHRAPTDRSIELAEEYREKAYKHILESVAAKDNKFNFKAILFRDPNSFQRRLLFSFDLNGRSISSEIKIKEGEGDYNMQELVYDRLAKEIARQMMLSILNSK